MADFRVTPGALNRMIRTDVTWLQKVGNVVRNEARNNVPDSLKGNRVSDPQNAIVAVPGADALSPYVDVGYDKTHPGFYLWWWEVGTQDHAAIPHLRPAVRPGILGGSLGNLSGPSGRELVQHTTRDGRQITATRAQVANWTRGPRTS